MDARLHVPSRRVHRRAARDTGAIAWTYIEMYIRDVVKQYSIAEARSHLPAIVDEAEAGGEVELTRRGRPVAMVVSLREIERLRGRRSDFASAYRIFLARHAVAKVGLPPGYFDGTRDRESGRKVRL